MGSSLGAGLRVGRCRGFECDAPPFGRGPLRPGPEARSLARHKQSSGLFVSGLGARSCSPVAELAARTGVRSAQTSATSQITRRAARAGRKPWPCRPRRAEGPAVRKAQTVQRTVCVRAHLLGAAPGAPPAAHPQPSYRCCRGYRDVATTLRRLFPWNVATGPARAHPGRLRRAYAVPRSAGPVARARSALRHQTRRACLSAAPTGHGASCATGPWVRCTEPGHKQS
jgi:hypothetical protein